ncbi:NEDD8-activating enzyme E1 regulatory subunit [Galdieria sulphuraria]|nr:NEDD8-activating enzyme E1 regulatory subunit [Galdieria sulphuraria]
MVAQELRLSEPFEELEQYCNNFPLESLDDANHSLVPYAVILVKAFKAFMDSHQGRRPETREDQEAIRLLLRSWMRTPTEENFMEALKHCHFIWMKSLAEPNESLQSILKDYKTEMEGIQLQVDRKDRNLKFWILVAAVKHFVIEDGQGKLPLKGSVPDMISDTESFIGLQRVYKKRAEKEHRIIYQRAQYICKQVGLEENFLSPLEVFEFCRNIRSIAVMRYCSLQDEFQNNTVLKDALKSCLDRNEEDAYFYIAFRACLQFHHQQGHFPGQVMNGSLSSKEPSLLDYEQDYIQLAHLAEKWCKSCDIVKNEKLDATLREMCRYGGSELHSIAALTGGVAAQEIVKLVTKQFRPLSGWFIFNGAQSTSATVSLCTHI